jgi:hypothetical protein
MLRPATAHNSRGPPRRRVIVSWAWEYRWIEIDPGVHPLEGEHPLEAMCHWHDPMEWLRTLRCGGSLDDNPSSG